MKRILRSYDNVEFSVQQLLAEKRKISIQRFRTGTVTVPKSGMINLSKKEDSLEQYPVFSYVVTHHSRGSYLIDSGLDSSFKHKPFGSQKGPIKRFLKCKGHIEEAQCIKNILADNNVSLRGVFLSHLHYDHTAGMLDITDISECFVGAGESYNAFKPLYYGNWLKHVDVLNEIDFSKSNPLGPFKKAVDFFGDGSFILIQMPGHTAGHIGFLINSLEETALIVGDAMPVSTQEFLDKGAGSFTPDKDAGLETVQAIREFQTMCTDVRIYRGHEE